MNTYWHNQSRNRTRGMCSRLIACIVIGALALPIQGIAQLGDTRDITIRGYHFDPAKLEKASEEELAEMGIDPRWHTGLPPDADAARWRILQFTRPLNRDTREQLRSRGLRLEYYVDSSYLEKVTDDEVESLKRSGLLGPAPLYYPEFKVAPSLKGAILHQARKFQSEKLQNVEGLLLRATVFPDEDIDTVSASLSAAGAEDILLQDSRRAGGQIRFQIRLDMQGNELAKAIHVISQIPAILSIEEVGEVIPLNAPTAATHQSGTSTNPSIWERGIKGQGQIVNIVEKGLPDIGHCMLADPAVANNMAGPSHRKIRKTRGNTLADTGHAVFVTASAAGAHFEPGAMLTKRGGAWSAKLHLTDSRQFDDPPSPPSTLTIELTAASAYAHIHSNSYHIGIGYSTYARDFDRFSYTNEDHLVIAAAGRNTSVDWRAPAIAKNALTVSAASADRTHICNVYQNPPSSERQKPDIAVVGDGIVSAVPGGANDCDFAAGECATSWATPHAAALAALARQYFTDGWHLDEGFKPSGALIKATLINAAQDIATVPGFPNEREGWGAVTLDRTLSFADDDHKLWVRDIRNTDAGALDVGSSSHEYELDVASSTVPLKATLVWTDPVAINGTDDLVNDLNLEVEAPDGTSYLGNVFYPTTAESKPGGAADYRNNVEQVMIGAPTPGNWTVRVKEKTIKFWPQNMAGQGYALVVTAELGEPTLLQEFIQVLRHAIQDFFRMLVILMVLVASGVVIYRRLRRDTREPDS